MVNTEQFVVTVARNGLKGLSEALTTTNRQMVGLTDGVTGANSA